MIGASVLLNSGASYAITLSNTTHYVSHVATRIQHCTVHYSTQRAIILAERRSRKIESIRFDSTRYRAIRADARARRRRNWGRESSRRRARACHQRAGDRSLSLLFDIFGFRYYTVLYCIYRAVAETHETARLGAPRAVSCNRRDRVAQVAVGGRCDSVAPHFGAARLARHDMTRLDEKIAFLERSDPIRSDQRDRSHQSRSLSATKRATRHDTKRHETRRDDSTLRKSSRAE